LILIIKIKFTGKQSLTEYFMCLCRTVLECLKRRERSNESLSLLGSRRHVTTTWYWSCWQNSMTCQFLVGWQKQWIVAAAHGISHVGLVWFHVKYFRIKYFSI